jgi:hypothetical protein
VQRLFDAGGMGSGKMSSAFVAHGNWRQDCIAWLTPARAGALPMCAELDAKIHALCNAVGRTMEAQRHMKLTGRHDTQLAVFPGDGSAFKRHSGARAPPSARAAMRFASRNFPRKRARRVLLLRARAPRPHARAARRCATHPTTAPACATSHTVAARVSVPPRMHRQPTKT